MTDHPLHDQDTRVTLGVIHADLSNMKASLAEIKDEIKEMIGTFKKDYITKEEFAPVKALVYSFAGIVMTGFVLAVLALVFKQ